MRVPTDLRLYSVITPGVTLAKRKIVSLSGLKSLDGLRNKTNLKLTVRHPLVNCARRLAA